MKQAVQEIKHQKLSAREGKCQMSVLEAVYLCLPELWPRKCQPGALYLNTNYRKLYRSTNNWEVALQNLCLLEFAASYYKKNC